MQLSRPSWPGWLRSTASRALQFTILTVRQHAIEPVLPPCRVRTVGVDMPGDLSGGEHRLDPRAETTDHRHIWPLAPGDFGDRRAAALQHSQTVLLKIKVTEPDAQEARDLADLPLLQALGARGRVC